MRPDFGGYSAGSDEAVIYNTIPCGSAQALTYRVIPIKSKRKPAASEMGEGWFDDVCFKVDISFCTANVRF
jgi:hypothetical protein